MARLDLTRRTVFAKIVYYGPGLGGKTTNLEKLNQLLSGGDELMSLATHGDRTVFFDFLPTKQHSIGALATTFKLYTVPGQVRYNQTRKMVLKNVDGIVFVADSQRRLLDSNRDSFANLFENLAELGIAVDDLPLVLQYNKRDLADLLGPEALDEALNQAGYPRFLASAINGEGVEASFDRICELVSARLRTEFGEAIGSERPAGIANVPTTSSELYEVAEEADDDSDDEPVHVRIADLERLPSEQAQGQIKLAELASEVGRVVAMQQQMLKSVTSTISTIKQDMLSALQALESRVTTRIREADQKALKLHEHVRCTTDELRYALAGGQGPARAWLAETVIEHAEEIRRRISGDEIDRDAILGECQNLQLAAEGILRQEAYQETMVGVGPADRIVLREESPESESSVDDTQRARAARIARVMVADLYLYHRDEVEDGIREGDLLHRLKGVLKDMRETYEQRVDQAVRKERDYLQIALDAFVERKTAQH